MQIVASLLAVPLGLASGYSIYRANFSPETTCQTLRGNIIGMLDLPTEWQLVITGIIIIVAVAFDELKRRRAALDHRRIDRRPG